MNEDYVEIADLPQLGKGANNRYPYNRWQKIPVGYALKVTVEDLNGVKLVVAITTIRRTFKKHEKDWGLTIEARHGVAYIIHR